jgi:hypothetical protein
LCGLLGRHLQVRLQPVVMPGTRMPVTGCACQDVYVWFQVRYALL